MDNIRNIRDTLLSLSPVALVRLVGKVAPRRHNPEAANIPIVRHWLRKSAEGGNMNGPQGQGV